MVTVMICRTRTHHIVQRLCPNDLRHRLNAIHRRHSRSHHHRHIMTSKPRCRLHHRRVITSKPRRRLHHHRVMTAKSRRRLHHR
ncbi:hypothetical protein LSAT2_015525, partial [Lamellibrachia satsuma]